MRGETVRTTRDAGTWPAVRRLAGAPISWGVCEVPGWGLQLPPDRVLGEMAALGLTATELGPVGYLPLEAGALRALLDRHGMTLVGGFVPLVLHEPDAAASLHAVDEIAAAYAAAGADVFVAALVMDAQWAPPAPLDDARFAPLTEHLAGMPASSPPRAHVRPAPARRHARRDRRRRRAAARRHRRRLVP